MNTLTIVGLFLAILMLVISLRLLIFAIFRGNKKKNRYDFDQMEGTEFEEFCANLLEENGFSDVTITKASGDFGIDILALKDEVTYGIQCKRYTDSVGVKAVQEAYAGKEYYDRMVGVVLTNQYFTEPAKDAAKKLKIILWDRERLHSFMEAENGNS